MMYMMRYILCFPMLILVNASNFGDSLTNNQKPPIKPPGSRHGNPCRTVRDCKYWQGKSEPFNNVSIKTLKKKSF